MSIKIVKKFSPTKPKNHADNVILKEYENITDINELQRELKIKNKNIFELKNKNHEQKILLKFFLNNAENLDDLLIIEKKIRVKDEEIEKIRKELNDMKINNENLAENLKKNFNEKTELKEVNKAKEKIDYDNVIKIKDEEIKKLENEKKEMAKELKKVEIKIKMSNEKLEKYEKTEKEKNDNTKNEEFIKEIKR